MDFVDTELLSPTEGDCVDQYLVVRSSSLSTLPLSSLSSWSSSLSSSWTPSRSCSGSTWSTGFNRLCGINPDQHFYVHLDKNVGISFLFKTLKFSSTKINASVQISSQVFL